MVVRVVPSTGDGEHSGGDASVGEGRDGSADVFGDVSAWLRDLVWSLGPVAPGVAVTSADVIEASAAPGTTVSLQVSITNLQATPTPVTLWPSQLRSADGDVWLPEVTGRSGIVVGAAEQRTLVIDLVVPAELPTGEYHGSLVCLAVHGIDPPLVVQVDPVTP